MLKCTLETTEIFGITRGDPGSFLLNYNGYGWPLHFSCSSMLCSMKVFSSISFCETGQREELNFNSGLESRLNEKVILGLTAGSPSWVTRMSSLG